MLDLAIKHQEALKARFLNTWLDERYQYYHAANYQEEIQIADSTWTNHQFVSLADGNVIGYIGYQIDRSCDYVYNLGAINFTDRVEWIFAIDLGRVLHDIFKKYHFRRLEWTVVCGNPAERSYDRICEKYGGRIVGIYQKRIRLTDGAFYDEKLYELSQEAYYASKREHSLKRLGLDKLFSR